MSLQLRRIALTLLLCLALPVANAGSALTDLQGRPAALADLVGNGQWTVVMIWASDCGICRYEAPQMEDFHQRHRDSVAQVVGLSVDGVDNLSAARAFVRDQGLSFANLVAEGEEAAALFYDETGNHLVGTPAFLIYNPQGVLRSYQTGRLNMLALEQLVQPQATLSVAEGR